MAIRLVSGGQTGADRGGLDAAMVLGLAHGGWCPRGRRAEDGKVPSTYLLQETASTEYPDRTLRNIMEADATLLFTHGPPQHGSRLTQNLCLRYRRPLLWIDLDDDNDTRRRRRIRAFARGKESLNIAGSRESSAPGIQAAVRDILVDALRGFASK